MAVIAVVAFVTAVLIVLYRLGDEPDTSRADELPSSLNPYAQDPPDGGLPSIRATNDAIPYARAISEALFNWDTTSGLYPRDYAAVVLAEAAPDAEEARDLATDVAGYLPADDVWEQLRQYQTKQRIEVYSARVASGWSSVVEESHGQVPDGTTAVTIRAFRYRDSVHNDEQATVREKVTFTVFLACPPRVEEWCRLLRFSELNDPL
ncbi:hypothetical protein C1I92_02290 [Jiangella anatolica]|uniref:Uncharacterized protein n=2 Tax=Jiangella anatolica TaxID=2670374 RepID=A0A2W2CCU8_9ACTN|nr:hypothetical protein C1I92_02290 [Jiangella anatolica]